MDAEPEPASVVNDSPLEITTNFGVFAGREVGRNEIDDLGRELMSLVSGVTVVAGRRYEFAVGSAEVAGYQVSARFDELLLPTDPTERDELVEKLLATINAWTRGAATTPPQTGEDLATRIARGAAEEAWRDDTSG